MAQHITILGASYSDVPAVTLPKTGGGTASFTDVTDTTAAASDVASGKYFYTASGVRTIGTSSGGGGGQMLYCGSSDPSASVGSDGDIYIKLSGSGTAELYPEAFTAQNMNSTTALGNCIGVSAEDGSSTTNVYSSGSSVTGTADYTFDFSSIPSNATIDSLSLVVKAHEENASRSVCTIQLYAGSTAKGSLTTVNGTSNALYTITTGTWTRAELDTLVMRLSLGYYGGLIAGATMTVEYSLANPSFDVKLIGDANGWSISGNGIYQKTSGTWASVQSVSLDATVTKS